MSILVSVLLGIFTWPALEYFLHRYLGHEWKFENLFRKEHQTHHRVKDFFAPAWKKATMAVAVLGGIYFLGRAFGLRTEINFYVAGILGMYLFYEWTHYSFHRYAPRTALGRKLRKHHFAHHFKNANANFGVTTTFFDRIFGTYLEPGRVPVPKSFAMQWVQDNQDYQLR